ncbi:substrate-binding domain-containing protein [Haloechinothrix sp. LS1_15]|uniref:substrate-binding domain-containing protein n=1 Tax=Haloechinothrix sp. LS1_15 TaxID=2652248 RepID=UPI00294B7528|nr:substrate-binding domain-containing protein [Haloechinothrix sp. LS1_15]
MGGRHRQRDVRRGSILAAIASGVAIVLAAGAGVVFITSHAFGCPSTEPFVVEADPAIAPALTEYVTEDLPDEDGDVACLEPRVEAVEPFEAAGRYSADNGGNAGTGGEGAGAATLWIPDSTIWLQRANEQQSSVPARGTSVATSPVVLATSEERAAEAGWPGEAPSWSAVLDDGAVAGSGDPSASAAGLIAVTGIGEHDFAEHQRTRIVQSMAKHAIAVSDNPFNRLPGGGTEPQVDVFPTAEQRLISGDGQDAALDRAVTAAYPDVPIPWLDFPAVVLGPAGEPAVEAAATFRDALTEPTARARMVEHGFRDGDGELATGADTGPVAEALAAAVVQPDAGTIVPPPSTDAVDEALTTWSTVSKEGRMLVVTDVSGSMAAEVPGTELTRMEVTLDALTQGLHLLRPGTELAMWQFSHEIDGERHHTELAPWRTVRDHLASGLPQQLPELIYGPGRGTALYDTTLDAYDEMLDARSEEQLSLIVIFTDGKDENPDGISRDELVAGLDERTGADQPVPIVYIGLGTDVEPEVLADIVEVTGGDVFLSEEIADLEEIFFDSLSALACPPRGC